MRLRDRGYLLVQWAFLDPRAVWGSLGVPAVILATAWLLPLAPELRVRIAGFVVTLAGVVLVVVEILDRQHLFNLKRIPERVLAWLNRFPRILLRPRPNVFDLQAAMGGLGAVGKAQVRVSAGPGASLERRVTILEQNLQLAEERITEVETDFTTQIRRLQSEGEAERRTREEHDLALRKQVEQLSVGGLDFELMGVVWVIIGSAFSTFPGEIARIAGRVLGG
jgi:hypothetical protein